MQQNSLLRRTFPNLLILVTILSGLTIPCFADSYDHVEKMQQRLRLNKIRNNPFRNVTVKKNLTYASVDGIDLKLDLYVPQKAEGPMPLVVWIHGGGWRSGSKDSCPALPMLRFGFAVASINYRLTDVAVFPAQIHDCKAAIRYLRATTKTYNIDPDRIGVWGASAGGHLAALLGTTNGNKKLEGSVGDYLNAVSDVQAVCDWFGPSDFLTMPIGKRQFKAGQDPEVKFLGGSIAEKQTLAEQCSPATHVTKDAPPFLIMHGDQDPLVPLQQSQLLYDLLKAAGVDSKLIVMEGSGHGFGRDDRAGQPVIEFFRRTLGESQTVSGFETDTIETASDPLSITFIGHGTLMMQYAGKVIHIDPWTKLADYSKLPKADIILITHDHFDHLDAKAVEQIRKDTTGIIVPKACAETVSSRTILTNDDSISLFKDVTVKAIPAYNMVHTRPDGAPYHPKGRGNGYVIDFKGTRVYVAGDTENTPEMKALKDIDIAFLPMNLPYTMTPEMVAEAAKAFKPKILYPYHYGQTDVSQLTKLMANQTETEVRIRNMQ